MRERKAFKVIERNDLDGGSYDLIILASYLGIYSEDLPTTECDRRTKEKHPSLAWQYYNGQVLYKNFATTESGNVRSYLASLWCVPYGKAVEKINRELKLNTYTQIEKVNAENKIYTTHKSDLKIHTCPFTKKHLDYWLQYNIHQNQLEYANVFAISRFFVKGKWRIPRGVAFAYVEEYNNKQYYKVYQPQNPQWKWTNGCTSDIVNLYNKIPKKGEYIIICSSMKDALCVWCNTRVPCIAFQSETANISPKIITELKSRFKKIFILYDNDSVGLKQGELKAKQFDLVNIVIPQFEGGKDISDLYISDKNKFYKLFKDYGITTGNL